MRIEILACEYRRVANSGKISLNIAKIRPKNGDMTVVRNQIYKSYFLFIIVLAFMLLFRIYGEAKAVS